MADVKRLKEELSEIAVLAWQRRLVAGAGGNVSLRIPASDLCLVTATGVALCDVSPAAILTMHLQGEIVDAPAGCRPSKETGFHLAAYRLRPEVGAIVHVHPPHATAFAAKNHPLPLVTDGAAARLKTVPCLGYAPSGSPALHRLVEDGLKKYPEATAFLLKNHGLIALGPHPKGAFYIADLVEDTAKIALWSRLVDEPPFPIVPDVWDAGGEA
ncbi:MAG: class II aldolase/adducin family protein [Candidatus Methylomirabilales bacterium]